MEVWTGGSGAREVLSDSRASAVSGSRVDPARTHTCCGISLGPHLVANSIPGLWVTIGGCQTPWSYDEALLAKNTSEEEEWSMDRIPTGRLPPVRSVLMKREREYK